MTRKPLRNTIRFQFFVFVVVSMLFIVMDVSDKKPGKIPEHLVQMLVWLAFAIVLNLLDRKIHPNRYRFDH
jgi:hypothetical protein